MSRPDLGLDPTIFPSRRRKPWGWLVLVVLLIGVVAWFLLSR